MDSNTNQPIRRQPKRRESDMEKTAKALWRWVEGKELEPKEWMRVDRVFMELKVGALTALIIVVLVLIIVKSGMLTEGGLKQ